MEVRLDHSLYPRDAIAMAVGAFSEACEFVEAETPGAAEVLLVERVAMQQLGARACVVRYVVRSFRRGPTSAPSDPGRWRGPQAAMWW
jgi:hypothetical protein